MEMWAGGVRRYASGTAGVRPGRSRADVREVSTGTCEGRDVTVNGSVETNAAAVNVINEGVKKASILIPHYDDI